MEKTIDTLKELYNDFESLDKLRDNVYLLFLKDKEKPLAVRKINSTENYSRLKGINIKGVPIVYNVFSVGNSNYCVTEFIKGESLLAITQTTGRLYSSEVKDVITSLCEVLAELHKRSIFFCSFNPATIILTSDNKVYFTSFDEDYNSFYNKAESKDSLNPQANIFSIGRLMVFLLSGEELKDLSQIKSLRYSKIILKCLSDKSFKNPLKLKKAFNVSLGTVYYVLIFLAIIFLTTLVFGKIVIKQSYQSSSISYENN